MEYKNLRKLFHISEAEAAGEPQRRRSSKDAIHLDVSIAGHPGFYCMEAEIYQLIIQSERLDKQIRSELLQLPPIALQQHIKSTLIEEIVLTNEIEGVHSSRREIGEVLENLKKKDKSGRFQGIVEKYIAITRSNDITIRTCADIRDIYSDLVLNEVVSQDSSNAPDGEYFRQGPVSVLDEAGIPIHQGLEPESKIIQSIETALSHLNNEGTELLVRIALFHFLFAYIHPFYDGNGRMNRFISSYMMANQFNPIVGLRLSYAIKQQIEKYYKAFTLCEHPLNKGDLTPFIILFTEIVISAMEDAAETLKEKRSMLEAATRKLTGLPGINSGKGLFEAGNLLIQASLFADVGISMGELMEALRLSEPTVNKRLSYFDDLGIKDKVRQGKRIYHRMNLELLMNYGAE